MAVMPSHESVNTSGACAAAGQWFAVEPAHAAVVMDRGGGRATGLASTIHARQSSGLTKIQQQA